MPCADLLLWLKYDGSQVNYCTSTLLLLNRAWVWFITIIQLWRQVLNSIYFSMKKAETEMKAQKKNKFAATQTVLPRQFYLFDCLMWSAEHTNTLCNCVSRACNTPILMKGCVQLADMLHNREHSHATHAHKMSVIELHNEVAAN